MTNAALRRKWIVGLTRVVAHVAPGLVRHVIAAAPESLRIHKRTIFHELAPALFPDGFPCVLGDLFLFIHPASCGYYLDRFEPLCRDAFVKALGPNARVVDVGANAGYYTCLAARAVGSNGHVFAIEPSPRNLTYLCRNSKSYDNITVLSVAASDRTQRACFQVSEDTLNDAFVIGPYSRRIDTVHVDTRPLDDLISPPVSLIKIDVQGHEPEALRGMTTLIRQSPRLTLLIEWSPACLRAQGHDPLILPIQVQDLGLTIRRTIPHHETSDVLLEEALRKVKENPATTDYWNLVAEKP